MSLTVAAVQVPYTCDPYESGAHYHPASTPNIDYTRTHGTFRFSRELPRAVHEKHTRWSLSSDRGEGKAEEPQMSSDGSASRPLHHQYRDSHAPRFPQPTSDHVLPPIVSPSEDRKMDGQNRQSPTQSPHQRLAETAEYTSERAPRLLGVHSILNPSHGEEEARHPRRRVVSEMVAESQMTITPPTSAAAPAGIAYSTGLPLSELSPPLQGYHRLPRRILTPISPRLQRTASYGRQPGTIDAMERPFLPDVSRMATPEHTASNTLPPSHAQTSQVTQYSPFIVPAAPTPPLVALRQQVSRRASVSVVGSTRPSPSPSYADSYSQSGMSGQTSPSMHPIPGGPPGGATPSPSLGPMPNVPPGSLDNEQGFHGPVVSSGQNYQLLTVDTSKGHMQLPVEVQAASRMADEKRKRNAGASARFRARRKEKEREAASKISNLEYELASAQEDSRHYRTERDYLADIILKYVPQYESHLKNRPPSPRHKRGHHIPRPALPSIDSPLSTTGSDPWEAEVERPATRRRTETYTLPNAAADAPAGHQYPTSPYTPYASGHAQLPPPQQHASAQYAQSSAHVQGPPPSTISRPPAPHETHRQEQGYERSWPQRTNEPPR